MSVKQNIVIYVNKLPTKEQLKLVSIDLEKYMEEADNLIVQANRAEITDADTYAKGGDLISIGRTRAKKVEEDRLAIVGPFGKLVKFVNAAYKMPKERFTDSRSIIEAKMMTWKRAEDEKLRAEAAKLQKQIEAEALERAALEKTEEAQDEVMDQAAEAGAELVEDAGVKLQRGSYGSSTGTRKTYSTEVFNIKEFIGGLIAHIDNGNKREIELDALIGFKTSGMNKLAERLYKAGVRSLPGAKVVETEGIRVY